MKELRTIGVILLILAFPAAMLLTIIFCPKWEGIEPRTFLPEVAMVILTALCILWTFMYGFVGNRAHFKELRVRKRRGIGNFKSSTWLAWVLVNVLQPICTTGYVVWYITRFF